MKHLKKYNENDRFVSDKYPFGYAEKLQYWLDHANEALENYMFHIDLPPEEGGGKNGEGAREDWISYTHCLEKINFFTQKHNEA